jgi:hypothetical protein
MIPMDADGWILRFKVIEYFEEYAQMMTETHWQNLIFKMKFLLAKVLILT